MACHRRAVLSDFALHRCFVTDGTGRAHASISGGGSCPAHARPSTVPCLDYAGSEFKDIDEGICVRQGQYYHLAPLNGFGPSTSRSARRRA